MYLVELLAAMVASATGHPLFNAGILADESLQSLPQVQAVALASRLPLSLNNNGFSLFITGHETPDNRPISVDGAYVDERYFDALQVKLLAGRNFEPADRDERRRVVVISNAMAQRYWPGQPENALSRELRIREGGDPYRVIGVTYDGVRVLAPAVPSKRFTEAQVWEAVRKAMAEVAAARDGEASDG